MKESSELVFKLLDKNYLLTEEEKKQLNLSLFCLLKEKIIKKDILNKKVYYDLYGKQYLENILEIGNLIKEQLIEDEKSLSQTVEVELLNSNIYKGNIEELKKAIYYTHRLRDWIVHKDSYIVENKLIIKPFASDINPDPNYTIELNLDIISRMCDKKALELILTGQYNHLSHKMHGYDDSDELFVLRKRNARFIVSKTNGFATILDDHDYRKAFSLMSRLNARYNGNGTLPSRAILIDYSNESDGKLDIDIFSKAVIDYNNLKQKGNKKPVIFKLSKDFTKDEKLIRTVLEELSTDKEQIDRDNYFIAAIYNYALNVYAEKDKNKPNPRYFNLKSFKVSKIQNIQYKESNEAIINKIKNFNNLVTKQTNNIKQITNETKKKKITLELFNSLIDLYSNIEKHLTLQKDIISTSIRNSIDHGNININPSTKDIVLYDSEDNTKNINDNNCKTKIETNIEDLYNHLEEYHSGIIRNYSISDVLKDLDYVIHNSKTIKSLTNNTNIVINLLLERKVNLEETSLKEVHEELKNNLRKEIASSIKKSIK